MAGEFLDGVHYNEKKSSNRHLDKKVNEIVTAILNDMTVLVDNSHEEDVSLPELMDRLYNRVMTNDAKINQIISSGGGSTTVSDCIVFCKSLAQFPPITEAKEDVLYVDRAGASIYQFDASTKSYIPFVQTKITTDDIQRLITIINGGTASTVL